MSNFSLSFTRSLCVHYSVSKYDCECTSDCVPFPSVSHSLSQVSSPSWSCAWLDLRYRMIVTTFISCCQPTASMTFILCLHPSCMAYLSCCILMLVVISLLFLKLDFTKNRIHQLDVYMVFGCATQYVKKRNIWRVWQRCFDQYCIPRGFFKKK